MTYIVAVSGGIDSVVLLDMLTNSQLSTPSSQLVVAHVDHGIRDDSHDDALFVERLAQQYGLVYESTQLRLGAQASEERARDARYQFLNEVKKRHKAEAIVTAHHQDDVLETMMINLVRGTGWRGLCSLREHSGMLRPLLAMSKAEVVRYAIEHELEWRDDSTNDDPRYMRNMIRQTIMRRMTVTERYQLLDIWYRQTAITNDIEPLLAEVMSIAIDKGELRRYNLVMVDQAVAREMLAMWIGRRLETRTLDRLWHFISTARTGKKLHEDGVTVVATPRGIRIVSSSDVC
ncbi:MAG: tRNA lysidine(34) synthetase TilS [Candidatus Saccharimonadales bacterium]